MIIFCVSPKPFCEDTLIKGALKAYPADLEMSLEERGPKQKYLHTDLHLTRDHMIIVAHSLNSEFGQGSSTRQKSARLIPPFGDHLNHDKELYQFVAQTLSRFQQTCPHDSMLCMETMMDALQELRFLGFSYRQISHAVRCQKLDKTTPLVVVVRSTLKELARREKAERQESEPP